MKSWVAALSKILGYDDDGSLAGEYYVLALLITFVGLSFGCVVTTLFVGADAWRAFKQRKHWIPGDSLLLGALSLQLLMLLNKPSGLNSSFNDNTRSNPLFYTCEYLNAINGEWTLLLVGRVSTCVLMGCLLPGVATPLSTTLKTDMAALFISFALVAVYVVSHEIFILPIASKFPGYVASSNSSYFDGSHVFLGFDVFGCPPTDPWNSIFMELANVIILASMVTLALVLGCSASASIGIHDIVSRKIPSLLSPLKLSPHLYPPKILWEKVEELVLKSWIVVRTSNPQYIISRSILSSSVALIITVCNVVFVVETARCSYETKVFTSDYFYVKTPQELNESIAAFLNAEKVTSYHEGCVRASLSIPLILHYMVIFVGSAVVYYRCVTAAVLYPRGIRWKLWSVRGYWQIEDFWVSHLLDLIDGSKRHGWETTEESYLTKIIVRLVRSVRLHKLLPLIVCLQRALVFFSKGCWLLLELIFSNNFFLKLVMGPASEGLNSLYTDNAQVETRLEGDPTYAKYKKACITMQGENSVGLWIANKTSIEELKKQFERGEEEGNRCNELISLITDKCSVGFSGQRCVKPVSHPLEFEVESELNVNQHSCKMTAVSIVVLIFELSSFIQGETNNKAERAMKSCCQAWKIMDVVEYSDSEEAGLITAADELLEKFNKERKWLDHHFSMSVSGDRSLEAAKAAVESMFERGKEVANAYNSRAWEEVAAAYSMCRQCVRVIEEYEFNSVEGVLDKLEGVLADVVGSCIAKAAGVIAEDCKKWVTNLEEERIWNAAKIVGKVKAITGKTGVLLETTRRSGIDQSASGNGRHYFKRYEKFPTMAITR